MARDAVATMGEILPADVGGRDAVHVAVVAVKAASLLLPGQHIGIETVNGELVAQSGDRIGIVDPFLRHSVVPGERFWLYLYPRTITGLSHKWTHPAFADEPVEGTYVRPAAQAESMAWMTDFAGKYGRSAAFMIAAADAYLDQGEWLHGGSELEGEHVPDVFWNHYERVTGRVVRESQRDSFFSCSC